MAAAVVIAAAVAFPVVVAADAGVVGQLTGQKICHRVIGIPGETFVEYGRYMKAMAGFKTVIVNELTNGCLPGYLYTPESLVTGGYETDTSMMGPEFGKHLVETVLKNAAIVK